MNDLLRQFLKNHDIADRKKCHHGCEEEHQASGYKVTHLPDDEDGKGSSWGTVYYACPHAVEGPGKKCETKFPLASWERDELCEMHYELVGESDPK